MKIAVAIRIEDISSINELDGDFKTSYFLELVWRVRETQCQDMVDAMGFKGVKGLVKNNETNHFEIGLVEPNYKYDNSSETSFLVTFSDELFGLFWLPDIFLLNAKDNYRQSFLTDTKFLQFEVKFNNWTDVTKHLHDEDPGGARRCEFRLVSR